MRRGRGAEVLDEIESGGRWPEGEMAIVKRRDQLFVRVETGECGGRRWLQ